VFHVGGLWAVGAGVVCLDMRLLLPSAQSIIWMTSDCDARVVRFESECFATDLTRPTYLHAFRL
jgi:hypothetical protein